MTKKKEAKLPTFLKLAREKKGLSQSEAAKVLGFGGGQFISNWERGVSRPPVKICKKVARAYGANADVLFGLLVNDHVDRSLTKLRKQFASAK